MEFHNFSTIKRVKKKWKFAKTQLSASDNDFQHLHFAIPLSLNVW